MLIWPKWRLNTFHSGSFSGNVCLGVLILEEREREKERERERKREGERDTIPQRLKTTSASEDEMSHLL